MNKFKLINKPTQSHYFKSKHTEASNEKETFEVDYDDADDFDPDIDAGYQDTSFFADSDEDKFLIATRKLSHHVEQAGYSESMECPYISLILVSIVLGDGEFQYYCIKPTRLIAKENTIRDVNDYQDVYGEHTEDHKACYHVLPDGKIMELVFDSDMKYTDQLDYIYENISAMRIHCELDNKLLSKEDKIKKLKI